MPQTAWVPCEGCDEFWCTIHKKHASDCPCPAIEEWGSVDPYAPGSQGGPEKTRRKRPS